MAVVSIGGKALIPGPLITITKEYEASADGVVRRVFYNIVATGKMFAWKGSPNSLGVFWTVGGYPPDEVIGNDSRLAAIVAKEGALHNLLSAAGLPWLIQPWDGTAPITFNPKIKSIEFSRGQWYEYVDYAINMEADAVIFGTQPIGAQGGYAGSVVPEETWSIETADEVGRTYRLTHGVSLSAKQRFNANGSVAADGWQIARDIILGGPLAGPGAVNYLGIQSDKMTASGVLNYNTLSAFNYFRAENIDEPGGKFAVNETWLLYDVNNTADAYGAGLNANEEFTVTSRISGEDGKTRVSLEGSIKGLEVRNNTTWALVSTRYANAQAKWAAVQPNLLNRAQSYAGVGLNPVAINRQAGLNPTQGVITWSAEFDNRITPVIAGALSQTVTIENDYPPDIFASIPVLGRPAGPILQAIGTIGETSRTINIEAILPAATQSGVSAMPNTTAYVASLKPTANQVFLRSDRENWNDHDGRYSRNTTFVYQ